MSLFGELKRRNVVKMAMLYVVASWLLLQVADVLFEALELPAAWDRLVLALVILGFPIVLIFAWIFEMTPEGLKRESEIDRSQSITPATGRKLNVVIIVLLVLAILAVGADRLVPETPTSGTETAQTSTETEAPDQSIAVLPFANRSAREDDVYFVDGIHDDILTQLAKIGSLTVTSRTSVERFRDPSQHGGIREIARALGVRNILEGGVQRAGDRIRINVQLIDVLDDDHLWAETYNRELTASNLFAVQGEIAAAVADALRVALAADEKQALGEKPTESLAAYDLYLLGRFHWNQRTAESLELAKGYFEQAIAEDPEFVLALSGLADSYVLLVDYGNADGATVLPIAQEAIDKAMSIDDSVSEVWASLGLARTEQGDLDGAEQALLQAIELNPKNYAAWLWYSNILNQMRRFSDGIAALEQAYALEPMSKPVNQNLAGRYFASGDFVRARQHYERLMTLDEDQSIGFRDSIAQTYFHEGDFSRAITTWREILDDSPGDQVALGGIAHSWLALGDVAESRRWFLRAEDMVRFRRDMYWAFEVEEDYEGAIVYLEDKLKLDQNRRNLGTLHLLFRASYLGGDIPQAGRYLSEILQNLNGRFEVDPADRTPGENLLRATFLIRHGEEAGLDPQRGYEMVDEILAGLELLREQAQERPATLASLAVAYALKGDSLPALAALDEAVDRGFRKYDYMLSQPAFDSLRDSSDFVAITDRIETLLAEDRAELAQIEFEPYAPPEARQPVAMSREQFRKYEGYYTDGNVVAHFYVAEDGAYTAQLGQNPPVATLPFAEDMFFFPLAPQMTVRFISDDSGKVSHFLVGSEGNTDRMKRIPAPAPAIRLDRSIIERYAGTYAYDRLSGKTENRSEVDLWAGKFSVDEEGRAWIDFDNQPILELDPISETEFRIRGFIQTFRMVVDPDTGNVERMEMRQEGAVLNFEPQ